MHRVRKDEGNGVPRRSLVVRGQTGRQPPPGGKGSWAPHKRAVGETAPPRERAGRLDPTLEPQRHRPADTRGTHIGTEPGVSFCARRNVGSAAAGCRGSASSFWQQHCRAGRTDGQWPDHAQKITLAPQPAAAPPENRPLLYNKPRKPAAATSDRPGSWTQPDPRTRQPRTARPD